MRLEPPHEPHKFNRKVLPLTNAYHLAQRAILDLKAAVYEVLKDATGEGMSNAEIGRTLGIYSGHVGHEGHIPRSLLAIMESEGVVEQLSETKKWKLRRYDKGS